MSSSERQWEAIRQWVRDTADPANAQPGHGSGDEPTEVHRRYHELRTRTEAKQAQHDQTSPPDGQARRFVDPEALVCPGCGEQVRCEPPGYWRVCDGLPAPGFSHPDGTALCRHRDGTVAEPIETQP